MFYCVITYKPNDIYCLIRYSIWWGTHSKFFPFQWYCKNGISSGRGNGSFTFDFYIRLTPYRFLSFYFSVVPSENIFSSLVSRKTNSYNVSKCSCTRRQARSFACKSWVWIHLLSGESTESAAAKSKPMLVERSFYCPDWTMFCINQMHSETSLLMWCLFFQNLEIQVEPYFLNYS